MSSETKSEVFMFMFRRVSRLSHVSLCTFSTRGKYGEQEDKFTHTLALVFVQCIINAIFARIGTCVLAQFSVVVRHKKTFNFPRKT